MPKLLDPEQVATFHHDGFVAPIHALSPATRESGCMKMMPGSHRQDQIPHRDTLAEDNLLTRGQEIAVARSRARQRDARAR